MRTKSIISILFLVASLLSACSGNKPDDQEMVTLKITMSKQMSQAPIFIAEAEGYFAEYGLKTELISITPSSRAVPLLVSGDSDIYAGSLYAGFLNTEYMDQNIKVVADRGHIAPGGCTYQAIVVRRDLYENGEVSGPADLEGLTLSASTGGPGAYLLSTYLGRVGLTLNDVKMLDLKAPEEIQAYANKALAASTPGEPDIRLILDSGEAVILAKAEDVLGTFQIGVVAFNKKLLVDNRDIGARFLAAYLKGVEQYNKGKTERNLQILTDATGQSVEDLKAMCWVSFNNDGRIDFGGVDGFQKWSIASGYLDNPVTEEQFWDPSMLVAAQKLLNP